MGFNLDDVLKCCLLLFSAMVILSERRFLSKLGIANLCFSLFIFFTHMMKYIATGDLNSNVD